MTTPPEPPISWKAAWRMWAASRSDPAKMEHHDTLRTRLETIRQVFASVGIGDEFPPCERGCELGAGHDGPCPAPLVFRDGHKEYRQSTDGRYVPDPALD